MRGRQRGSDDRQTNWPLRRARDQNDAGFTLLELLVALGILALIVTVAYPQVTRYLSTARTETARTQMSALSTALELYVLDNGRYPSQQAGLTALIQKPAEAPRWNGPYIKGAQGLVDPWGQPYRYAPLPPPQAGFVITSLGRDNVPGGAGEDQDLVRN